MEKQRKPRKETFLKKHPYYEHDDFFVLATDIMLTGMADEQLIEKLKAIFLLAAEDHNDKAALKSLELLTKAYDQTKGLSDKQLRDYLMTEAYWKIPDMKTISHGRYHEDDEYVPTMLETKSWILEQVIRDWHVDPLSRKITKGSIRAFQFLIAAYEPLPYEPLPEDWKTLVKNAEFKTKSKGRLVSKDEKDGILGLIRKHDDRFMPKELEEWMKQPWIPNEFEKTLAIARTREGGPDLWRNDIRNAELVEPFSLDNLIPATLELSKRQIKIVADLDQKVQKFLERMRTNEWLAREKIGQSEYVFEDISIEYPPNHHGLIMITIKLKSDSSEELCRDTGRLRRHINKCISESGIKDSMMIHDLEFIVLKDGKTIDNNVYNYR